MALILFVTVLMVGFFVLQYPMGKVEERIRKYEENSHSSKVETDENYKKKMGTIGISALLYFGVFLLLDV